MVAVPSFALRDRVTIQRYVASGAHGDTYDEPGAANVRAQVEPRRRLIRRPDGSEATAEATAYIRPENAPVPVGSRVEWPTGSAAWYVVAGAGAIPNEVRPSYRELILERMSG